MFLIKKWVFHFAILLKKLKKCWNLISAKISFILDTLRVLIFGGTNFRGFCGVWSNSRNKIPAKYFSLQKFLPAKKSRKATILRFFHPWKTEIEIWFKQSESWSSRYIGWSSTIIFLATSFFDLGFCSISRLQRLAVSHLQK